MPEDRLSPSFLSKYHGLIDYYYGSTFHESGTDSSCFIGSDFGRHEAINFHVVGFQELEKIRDILYKEFYFLMFN
jgi:hypothetical protein